MIHLGVPEKLLTGLNDGPKEQARRHGMVETGISHTWCPYFSATRRRLGKGIGTFCIRGLVTRSIRGRLSHRTIESQMTTWSITGGANTLTTFSR